MHFQNDGVRQSNNNLFPINANDAIFGVRTTKNNSKIVILGISPYVLVRERVRRDLLESIISWLVEEDNGGLDGETSSFEGFETGNLNALDWSCRGDADWFVTRNECNSGSYCAQSGPIGNNQTTSLHLTLDCIDGEISFYCRVSSESHFDFLRFYIDGTEQDEWSGENEWIEVSFTVTAGTRQFEWTYSKDSSGSDGEDCAWIDDIAFPVNDDLDEFDEPEAFVGEWINDDLATGGMTRLIIGCQDHIMTVHGYGKCHPIDCDWGTITSDYTGNPFVAVYEKGFKTNTLTIELTSPNTLYVHSNNVFHDGSNRDYEADYYLHRTN
jgi:hypothetical protein